MNKTAKTYHTPASAMLGSPETPGALWYGVVLRRGEIHEVAAVREEGNEVLVSGPTLYGWLWQDEVIRDAD